jgi:hypothetical protein
MDLIAFRKNSKKGPKLGAGIEFCSTLRKYTADGFFTSEIGIKYLGYRGNTQARTECGQSDRLQPHICTQLGAGKVWMEK